MDSVDHRNCHGIADSSLATPLGLDESRLGVTGGFILVLGFAGSFRGGKRLVGWVIDRYFDRADLGATRLCLCHRCLYLRAFLSQAAGISHDSANGICFPMPAIVALFAVLV